jgi:hypothetical protein
MFSRFIIDDSRGINDTFRVIKMTIVSDAPSCGVILMTLKVSFTIIICFIIQTTSGLGWFRPNVLSFKYILPI